MGGTSSKSTVSKTKDSSSDNPPPPHHHLLQQQQSNSNNNNSNGNSVHASTFTSISPHQPVAVAANAQRPTSSNPASLTTRTVAASNHDL
jgi:hypothetical protein